MEVGVRKVCRGDFGIWIWGNGIRRKPKNFHQIGVERRYCCANPLLFVSGHFGEPVCLFITGLLRFFTAESWCVLYPESVFKPAEACFHEINFHL